MPDETFGQREYLFLFGIYIYLCFYAVFVFYFQRVERKSVRKSEETHERRRRSKTFYKVNKLDALFCIL